MTHAAYFLLFLLLTEVTHLSCTRTPVHKRLLEHIRHLNQHCASADCSHYHCCLQLHWHEDAIAYGVE